MKRVCCGQVVLWLALAASACSDRSDASDPALGSTSNPNQPTPQSSAGSTGTAPAVPASGTPAASPTPASTPTSSAPAAGNPPGMNAAMPAAPTPGAGGMPAAAGTAMMPTAPAASFPGETCDGCARFFLPMTAENQRGDFELDLAAPLDMTGATLRFRLMTSGFTGNAGGVSVYVRDAGNFDKGFVWKNLTELAAWTDVAVDFTNASLAGNPSFDITKVAKVGVQLNSAGAFAGANYQNAVVYLDSVRFSNAPAADLTFSDGIGDLALVSGGQAPTGTSVNFLGP